MSNSKILNAEEITARIAELEKANAEAPRWGAAVGARHEEIMGLRRAMDSLTTITPQEPK